MEWSCVEQRRKGAERSTESTAVSLVYMYHVYYHDTIAFDSFLIEVQSPRCSYNASKHCAFQTIIQRTHLI